MGEQEKIEIELTSRDVVDFNFAYIKRTGLLRTISFVGGVFLVNFIIQLSLGMPFGNYAFSIIFVLFSVLFPVMVYRGAVRSYQNKFMKEKRSYEFSPEGFRMESESITLKVLWPDVQRVIMSKKGIYLFTASNAGHLFPQRFLEGKDRIRTMVLQYTTPKSRSRGKSKFLLRIAFFLLIFLVTVGIVHFLAARNGG